MASRLAMLFYFFIVCKAAGITARDLFPVLNGVASSPPESVGDRVNRVSVSRSASNLRREVPLVGSLKKAHTTNAREVVHVRNGVIRPKDSSPVRSNGVRRGSKTHKVKRIVRVGKNSRKVVSNKTSRAKRIQKTLKNNGLQLNGLQLNGLKTKHVGLRQENSQRKLRKPVLGAPRQLLSIRNREKKVRDAKTRDSRTSVLSGARRGGIIGGKLGRRFFGGRKGGNASDIGTLKRRIQLKNRFGDSNSPSTKRETKRAARSAGLKTGRLDKITKKLNIGDMDAQDLQTAANVMLAGMSLITNAGMAANTLSSLKNRIAG